MARSNTAQMLADALARITTLEAALAATAAPASPSVHLGPSGKPDGREHPCTAVPPCGKMLRSAASASTHDATQPKWHAAATK